jgi:glycosyltransferase involved in cell wall biosynthesis
MGGLMQKGLVAICIPYYQKIKFLKRLAESILIQTYSDYVVIITDDSDDQNAEEYIKSLDNRFVYIHNDRRLGPTANCNRAMLESQRYAPEYIKVMHNDDYFTDKTSLMKMVTELDSHPDLMFTFSRTKINVNDGEKTYVEERTQEQIQLIHEDKYNLMRGNVIGAPSVLLVRNCGIYMDENLMWLVDVEWYIKLMEYNDQFSILYEPLISVGVDGDRVTDYCRRHPEVISREHIYIYVKHFQLQDNSIYDAIISRCVREYDGVKSYGFYVKEEYLAIMQDAMRDGRKLCIYLAEDLPDEILKKLEAAIHTEIEYYTCPIDAVDKYPVSKKLKYMDLEKLESKQNILCVIVKKKAQDIRIKLNENGISAVPLIERYLVDN